MNEDWVTIEKNEDNVGEVHQMTYKFNRYSTDINMDFVNAWQENQKTTLIPNTFMFLVAIENVDIEESDYHKSDLSSLTKYHMVYSFQHLISVMFPYEKCKHIHIKIYIFDETVPTKIREQIAVPLALWKWFTNNTAYRNEIFPRHQDFLLHDFQYYDASDVLEDAYLTVTNIDVVRKKRIVQKLRIDTNS